jgi:hypothetical protein
MICNVGGMDRALRGAIAVTGIGTALLTRHDSRWQMIAGLLGSIATFTFTTQYCPLNQLLGVNTCKTSLRKTGALKLSALASEVTG